MASNEKTGAAVGKLAGTVRNRLMKAIAYGDRHVATANVVLCNVDQFMSLLQSLITQSPDRKPKRVTREAVRNGK